jgi:hypothetical protein
LWPRMRICFGILCTSFTDFSLSPNPCWFEAAVESARMHAGDLVRGVYLNLVLADEKC